MSKLNLGVIIGRFQPLHKGHISLIKKSLETDDLTLVIVGSSNQSRSHRNPFSVKERYQMLHNVFQDEIDKGKLQLRNVPDFVSDTDWEQEIGGIILSLTESPLDVMIYTSSKDAAYYLDAFIYKLHVDNSTFSATDIRCALYEDTPAQEIPELPEENYEYLDKLCKSYLFNLVKQEYHYCKQEEEKAFTAHPYGNPIYPVVHAVLIYKNQVLVVERAENPRGKGQLALPGGYLNYDETTREGVVRELYEETGIYLPSINCREFLQSVEENLPSLSVRTLGINFMYVIDSSVSEDTLLNNEHDSEVASIQLIPLTDILQDKVILFSNHNKIVKRMIAMYATKGEH